MSESLIPPTARRHFFRPGTVAQLHFLGGRGGKEREGRGPGRERLALRLEAYVRNGCRGNWGGGGGLGDGYLLVGL